MNLQNPCGLHTQSRDSRFDRKVFLDHIAAANYSTLAFLDDFELAKDAQLVLTDAVISHRVYEKVEPGPPLIGNWQGAPQTNDPVLIKASAIAYIESRKAEWGDPDPRAKAIYLNINCEPEFTRSLCEWYVEMMEYCAPKGIRLLLGNFGSGRIKSGQGDDPNWWLSPEGEGLLRTFAQYRDTGLFLLGLHEYTTFYAWSVANAQAPERFEGWKFENAPRPANFNLSQWHIGRMYGLVKACKTFQIEPPRIVISESLLDDMADISNRMGVKLKSGIQHVNGWWTLEPQFREWYPNLDPGEVYAKMSQWAWEAVYAPLGCVVGMNNFTWNDASGKDWEWFRVDNSQAYRKSMESYRPMEALPIYIKNPNWAHRTQIVTVSSDLREQPYTASKSLGTLFIGTSVEYFSASVTADGWGYIEKGSTTNGGWVRVAYLADPPLPIPVLPPNQPLLVTWRSKFTEIELKIIDAAVVYSQDSYPDPGSHLKIIISKLIALL